MLQIKCCKTGAANPVLASGKLKQVILNLAPDAALQIWHAVSYY
jgi:hypothetical protein